MQRRSFSRLPAFAAAHALFINASSSRFCWAGASAVQHSQLAGCPGCGPLTIAVATRDIAAANSAGQATTRAARRCSQHVDGEESNSAWVRCQATSSSAKASHLVKWYTANTDSRKECGLCHLEPKVRCQTRRCHMHVTLTGICSFSGV